MFEVGKVDNRRLDIYGPYGGQRQELDGVGLDRGRTLRQGARRVVFQVLEDPVYHPTVEE